MPTETLVHDGVSLSYALDGDGPLVVLTGAPVGIAGYGPLAERLARRFTVLRHDPRGIGGTPNPGGGPVTPDLCADDLAALIRTLTDRPVPVFGASGGAVTGLALLTRHPELVHRLVAHEPPLFGLCADGPALLTAVDAAFALAAGDPQAAAQAFGDVSEAMHETFADAPRPPRLVLPPLGEAELERNRFFLGLMAPATVHYIPEFDLLPPARIVVAAGAASVGQPARRAAEALARRLGLTLGEAPGNHLAMALRPDQFAAWLAPLLAG